MSDAVEVSEEEAAKLRDRLEREARQGGYNLNPDKDFTLELVRGLLINERRYGYWACPCRLADGIKERDLDIICPCVYRDKDLAEFGACFCALYVDDDIRDGKKEPRPIPERRPRTGAQEMGPSLTEYKGSVTGTGPMRLRYPIWRCTVCGYICARDEPPLICPICKAKKERFERFL